MLKGAARFILEVMVEEPKHHWVVTPFSMSPEHCYTAAVAEALVQSHAGEISFLPSLPPRWPTCSAQGLRARRGYEVSMKWKGGKLESAAVHALKDGPVKVRYAERTATIRGSQARRCV